MVTETHVPGVVGGCPEHIDAYGFVFQEQRERILPPEAKCNQTRKSPSKEKVSLCWFEGRSKLGTWLYRVAYNLCQDRLRKRKPISPLILDFGDDDTIPIPRFLLIGAGFRSTF